VVRATGSRTARRPPPAPTLEAVITSHATDAHDRDLLSGIAAGNDDDFRRLFRRYAPTALALATRVVRDATVAEDVVQEAFLAVWRAPAAYEHSLGSVRSWLMGIVHHRAVDATRREAARRRRDETPALADPPSVLEDDVIEEVDLPGERRRVREALDALPAAQREVVELMYFSGLTQSQISQRLSLPLGTVKSRTVLAMRRLRGALAGGSP
jgi:RNA polymerase sigma factor (sigma-70 family)